MSQLQLKCVMMQTFPLRLLMEIFFMKKLFTTTALLQQHTSGWLSKTSFKPYQVQLVTGISYFAPPSGYFVNEFHMWLTFIAVALQWRW